MFLGEPPLVLSTAVAPSSQGIHGCLSLTTHVPFYCCFFVLPCAVYDYVDDFVADAITNLEDELKVSRMPPGVLCTCTPALFNCQVAGRDENRGC